MNDRERHIYYLRRCIEVSKQARLSGNTPFGAILVHPSGDILLEQGNIEVTESICTGHAETSLMVSASNLLLEERAVVLHDIHDSGALRDVCGCDLLGQRRDGRLRHL